MNFDLTDEQEVVRDLARQLFTALATTERVKAVERHPDPTQQGFDRQLWAQLAESGVLSLCLPAEQGGSEMGLVEAAQVLQEQGRTAAPAPLWSTVTAAMAIAEHGSAALRDEWLPGVASGEVVLAVALAEPGANDPMRPSTAATREGDGWRVRGWKPSVSFAQHAQAMLVPVTVGVSVGVVLVPIDADGVGLTPVTTTSHEPHGHLDLDVLVGADALLGPDADGREVLRGLLEHALVGLCALQVGVAEGALAHTAQHLGTRHQFGKPLSTFQATTQRAADGYITTEAMRVTTLNAAWRLAEGYDARRDVEVATYWATEGAQQVVLAAQHLHGGIGSDIDYPVHRHFLWGTQLGTVLGGASAHLARLGRLIAST